MVSDTKHRHDLSRTYRRADAQPDDLWGQYLREIGQFPLLEGRPEEITLYEKLDAGINAYTRLMTEDSLSPATKRQLEQEVIEGVRAYYRFYESNLRLVASYSAKRPLKDGFDRLDYVSFGNKGLERAIAKFDARKGFKFSTYAMWWIRQAVARGIADEGGLVRLPVHVHDDMRQLDKDIHDFQLDHNRRPTIQDFLDMGYKEDDIKNLDEIKRLFAGEKSIKRLDERVREDGDATFGDLVPDTTTQVDDPISQAVYRQRLNEIFADMNLFSRDVAIIALRYGVELDGMYTYVESLTEKSQDRFWETFETAESQGGVNLEEVGRIMGVTRERVRQIVQKSVELYTMKEHVEALIEQCNMDANEAAATRRHFIEGKGETGRGSLEKYDEATKNVQAIMELCFGHERLGALIEEAILAVIEEPTKEQNEKYAIGLAYRFGLSNMFSVSRSRVYKATGTNTGTLAVMENYILKKLTKSQTEEGLFDSN